MSARSIALSPDSIEITLYRSRAIQTSHRAGKLCSGVVSPHRCAEYAAGTAELGSCPTDATRAGRSRRAVLFFAATLGPNVWR